MILCLRVQAFGNDVFWQTAGHKLCRAPGEFHLEFTRDQGLTSIDRDLGDSAPVGLEF